MLCDGHKGTKALIDHSLPPDGISLPPLSDHPPPGQGWERAQRRRIEDDIHSRAHAVRVGAGSERNGEESKTTSTRERTPSGSGLGASATARDRRRHPLASARRQARSWGERNGGGSQADSTRGRPPSGAGLGASATARDRRRHPLASARRQARGWERAQRRRIEDDIHSRAHAVRAGAGSERNGGGSKTTTAREGTPSGPGLGASATAADRRRHPLASARRQGRGWKADSKITLDPHLRQSFS